MKQPAKSTPFVYLCPQCGELLYYRLRARDTQYGAPLRPCPHCGAIYFDPSYREPALEKRPRLPLLPGTVWGGLLLGLAFLLGAAFLPQKLELAVMGVLFFGASLCTRWTGGAPPPSARPILNRSRPKAAGRLQDAAYRRALREHGVKLPEEKSAD